MKYILLSLCICLANTTIRPDLPISIRKGKDLALFFVVENYDEWDTLKFPIDDAEEIADILERDYDFDTRIIPNPTKATIDKTLRQYISRSYATDAQLLLWFGGHGTFDDLIKTGYFIPKDGQENNTDKWFSFLALQQFVKNIPCRHILLSIDACYSGTFDQAVAMRGKPDFGRPMPPNLTESDIFIQQELELRSRLFLASGKKERVPDESDFAAYFKRALRKHGGDDYILSFKELDAELDNARPKPHVTDFEGNQQQSNFLFIGKKPNQPKVNKEDEQLWQIAIRWDDLDLYEKHQERFPNSPHRAERGAAIKRLKPNHVTIEKPSTSNAHSLGRMPHMAFVKGGEFQMGDLFGEGDSDEKVHTVRLDDFYIGRHEVTFEEYDQFCEATKRDKPSDRGWGRGKRPVINVSWYDVIEYCNWRSKKEGLQECYAIDKSKKDPNNTNSSDDLKWIVTCNWKTNGYRLPTEAEWEYAARQGGQKVRFGNGKDIADPKEINFDGSESEKKSYSVAGEYRRKTVPVGGLKSPNQLGLHDMSGNVREWCWDWKGSYPSGTSTNPKGATSGSNRVLRGGSWGDDPSYARAANRSYGWPYDRDHRYGFRLSRAGTF